MPSSSSDDDVIFAAGCSPVCDVVRRPKRKKKRSRPWHRVLGMIASLPLIWVLITGFFLNHAEDFKLDEKNTSAPWLMRAYGMMPNGEPRQLSMGEHTLAEWDGLLFLNEQAVEHSGKFIGGALDNQSIVVVYEDAVLRYTLSGDLIETLDELSLPELPIKGVGQNGDSALLENADGWYQADADWIEWEKVSVENIQSNEFVAIQNKEQRATLARLWNGGGLSYYRVVLDMHAGNFLGSFAKYFYDLVIVCTLWLIGTGLVLQYRTTKRARQPKP